MNILEFLVPIAQAAEEAVKAEKSSGGIPGTFGIQLQYFIFQLINFSIILFVLTKFVFGPVTRKLQERADKLDAALADAERIELEKKEFDNWKRDEMSKSRKEAAEIVAQAQVEAVRSKEEIVASTKIEQEKLVKQAKAHIEEDERRMVIEVKGEVADMVTKATEKILRKKLDGPADKKLIEEALQSIK